MTCIHRQPPAGSGSSRTALRIASLAVVGSFIFFSAALTSVANAAFTITGFSVASSTKSASAHPNLTVTFNRGVTNTDDLRDFAIDFPTGLLMNPEAAVSKCTSTQFASDTCPSASVVGDFSADANLEILGFSFPTSANGTIYVLAPTGLEHATLGYALRPSGYAKSFSKQVLQLRPDSDGGAKTVTTNQLRAQATSWPRIWGSTNIAIRKLTLRYNNRANAGKTGPYFTLNPSACAAATARITASSYASEAATATGDYTATNCTIPTFLPTMTLAVDNNASGEFTAATFQMDLPQAESTIQPSPIKTVSAQLPVGTNLNSALLGTYTAGCQEAELLAESCPETALIGTASAGLSYFPPNFDGAVYLMEPLGATLHGAVVLVGPRNMKSILRFSSSIQGSGSTARVLTLWDYLPHVPFNRVQMYLSEPFLKNPDCPGGAKASSVTFTSYSNRTRTVSPSYTTTCTSATPAPPVITSPATGTSTSDSTPTFTGTAPANATITVLDGASSIGTTTANAAGSWTFTPASSIGSNVSSITATATVASVVSTPSTPVLINVDAVAPVAPVITTTAGATKDNTPTFGGTAEVDSTIIVLDGAAVLGSTTTDASGIWSFTSATLTDGSHSISVTATDAAGNVSPASTQSITVDTVAPAAPTISSPAAGSTIGDNTPTIAGGAESGASIRVVRSGTQLCAAIVNVAGAWSCDASSALPDGTYTITAVATDEAGNSSASSASVTFTVAPVVPVQITTGPRGGLPIDATTWLEWYEGVGTNPLTGQPNAPHKFPSWSFSGNASSTYECSLVLASEADSFAPCTSPYVTPFAALDASNPAGTDYRFSVRYANNTSVFDTALFSVGAFTPSSSISLTDDQALSHPDMTLAATNPFGDIMTLFMQSPDNFWASLDAVPQRCSVSSAQSGTCATTAPNSKIGTVALTLDIDPNPHTAAVAPHPISRSFDVFLTPPTRAGDAAGVAVSIRVVDDAANGSRDYGAINYIGRMKLRYSENVVHPDEIEQSYIGVSDPTGFDLMFNDIPSSTSAAPGPHGAADAHIRSLDLSILGTAPWYDVPLLWNSGQCDAGGEFKTNYISSSFNIVEELQAYQPTGCSGVEFEPAVTQFSVSDNAATDAVNDLNLGVSFPSGNATASSLIVDLPRELVVNPAATQRCSMANVMVADPQASCPDSANLGSVTVTSPLFPNPLVGYVIGEDDGQTLPRLYMVLKDPDIGLDLRLRASLKVFKTGTGAVGQATGDFIRATFNVGVDSSPLELPGIPLTSLVLNLHQEDSGVTLPDNSVSDGPIMKVGSGYECNSTASARFILESRSGQTRQIVNPPVNFDCAANEQSVADAIDIVSGPANGATINTEDVNFVVRNNLATSTRLRMGLDDGTGALSGSNDADIEPNSVATPTTDPGATRAVTFTGLQHGKVYKFLVQNIALGADFDQERRAFKVHLLTGPPPPPVIESPANGSITNSNVVAVSGTSSTACTVVVYDGAAAIGSTAATPEGTWSFVTSELGEGQHTFTARCNTSGGFQSDPSAARTVTVDTIPPTAPVITSPTDAQTGTVTNVVGTAEPGSTVTVREGASVICTTTASGGGGWMCGPAGGFSAGNHVVCATATDAAGNEGVPECVQFGDASAAKARILTGPEGGLPIVITHDIDYYNAGNEYPKWTFKGGATGASYECSLVKAANADSFSPCSSPFTTPFEGLDDSVPTGTDYRFRVRIAGLPASVDTALFKVGQFNPSWNVGLSTLQALGHPDLTATISSPFGDAKRMRVASPDYFMGSLSANPIKCQIASAEAGTCAQTAPVSKIGSVTFTADVNPNPHNDFIPPHTVTRTFDAFLTPALHPGDAAGIAMNIRAIDDPAFGSLDYGTINYIARMKLRYDGPGGDVSYTSVLSPRGMDMIMDDIPNSTLTAPGVTPGPAGSADLHVRGVTLHVMGDSFDYASPLLYNSSDCTAEGEFSAFMTSGANQQVTRTQPYQATGCENIDFEPSVIQFGVSDNGAGDLVNEITLGVSFPEGNATTRAAVIDMPREFIANLGALQTCLTADLTVEDPQSSCIDGSNLGTAVATSPLLPYSLTGEVFAEDNGGSLPNMYMVFKDPQIGLDTRIRGSLATIRTGSGSNAAQGDFIRTTMNLFPDGTPTDLPSLPMSSLVVNLHSEDPGTLLPDGSTSLGPIIKIGTGYACNATASSRLIMKAWNGLTAHLMSTPVNFNCSGNGNTLAEQIEVVSGPANSEIVNTSTVTYVLRNNHTQSVRFRTGLDDGTYAEQFVPQDSNIEPNASPTPLTPVGSTRTVDFTGLQDGKVYKFIVQANAGTSAVDQERRVFKVELP